MCLLMGEGMACGGLPFPGAGCPIPDVDYLCLLCFDCYRHIDGSNYINFVMSDLATKSHCV